jgi:succinate dehydrogenase / fumarate reductase cytochrome b subunit|tara:strand:- start:24 stop:407 length:384 start_codon:yes stop_codon:yes gene_type:complete
MENKNPLSPHIQIYKWHISSLVSISHRITGIINIIAITLVCIWASFLILGDTNYSFINLFLNSFLGKFIAIGLAWSFSFQILSEIRHLIMDMGYGFELQTTRITGLVVIFGSVLLTILTYLIGKNFI